MLPGATVCTGGMAGAGVCGFWLSGPDWFELLLPGTVRAAPVCEASGAGCVSGGGVGSFVGGGGCTVEGASGISVDCGWLGFDCAHPGDTTAHRVNSINNRLAGAMESPQLAKFFNS